MTGKRSQDLRHAGYQSPHADFCGAKHGARDGKGYRKKKPWRRTCEGPGCEVVYETQYARSRFCSAACKRAFERDVRRRGKAANLTPEMAERAERAEAALRWMEDQAGKHPLLERIYRRFVTLQS